MTDFFVGEIADCLMSFSDELSGVWNDTQAIVSTIVHLGKTPNRLLHYSHYDQLI